MSGRAKSYLLVTIQFACLLAIALTGPLLARNPLLLLLEGAGIALGLWAVVVQRIGNFNITPEIRAAGTMVKSGPYALIRHPMYAALIVVCAALVADSSSWLRLALLLLLVVDLVVKLQYEERLLVAHYPNYTLYQKDTWRLIPFVY